MNANKEHALRLYKALIVFALIPSGLSRASFDGNSWGIRAAGMGGAFSASADDASAPFWNSAGGGWLDRGEASFMWEDAYPGLTDVNIASGFLSVVKPSPRGFFGAALTTFEMGGLLSENVALLHCSRKIRPKIGMGGNLKYLMHDYTIGSDPAAASNPIFANITSKSAVTFDAGLIIQPSKSISLGLTGRNITEPDVGLVLEDRMASEYQGGLAWKPAVAPLCWTGNYLS